MISILCIYFLIYYIQRCHCQSFNECGISYTEVAPQILNHVVDGHRSKPSSWPWVVAIYADGQKICTGSIISRNYVLTAAHCYIESTYGKDEIVEFSIHAGSIFASGAVVVKVKGVKIFDDFYTKENISNDIALFELATPLRFNQNISRVCLPKSYKEVPLKNAFLAGFGEVHWKPWYQPSDMRNYRLLETTMPFQEFNYCKHVNDHWGFKSDNYICSGAQKRGSAPSDSGGPLMDKLLNHDFKSRWFEIGLIKGGFYPEDGPKRFWSHILSTRVSFYCDWIEENTGGDAKCIDANYEPPLTTTMHPMAIFSNDDECGISHNEVLDTNVVGGHRSSLGSWPWVVAIYANGKKICTGSIISRNYVLTAAHCKIGTQGSNDKIVQFSIHAGSILTRGGDGIDIDVEDVIIFNDFYSSDSVPNDIALFQLKTPLTFNQNITKICLPKSYVEIPLNIAFLAAFGELDWNSIGLNNFRMTETNIPFQHFDHCQRFTKEWNYTSQNYICLGAYKRGSGPGDNGGPFMVKLQGKNGPRWFEVGILAGAYYSGSKNDLSHIASTRVSAYCDWIEEKTNGDAKCIDANYELPPATIMHPMTIFEKYTTCQDTIGYEKLCIESLSNGKCERYEWSSRFDHTRHHCVKSCGYCDKMKSYVKERFKKKPPTNLCHDKMHAVYCYIQRFRWGYCDSPLPHFNTDMNTRAVNHANKIVQECRYTCELC